MSEHNPLIYLDHAATTPVDPLVLEEMLPYYREKYGNPSAFCSLARQSKKALEDAREKVAQLIGAKSGEIIFTGSGTESDNLAILGIARAYKDKGKHIITTPIEHHAVLHPLQYLAKFEGFEVDYIPVDRSGVIDLEELKKMIRKDTVLISVMYANNEIGTVEPIQDLVQVAKSINPSVIIHTDACQCPGFLPLDVSWLGVDLMTLNGSKIYGPKGVGILYKREKIKLNAIQFGGTQEDGYRPGTENVAHIVGFAKALELVIERSSKEISRLKEIADYFRGSLKKSFPDITFNGSLNSRLVNNIHISLPNIEGEAVLFYLDKYNICASSGSACTTNVLEPSHVLKAIRVPQDRINGSLRFTLGKSNSKEQIDIVIDKLKEIVSQLS